MKRLLSTLITAGLLFASSLQAQTSSEIFATTDPNLTSAAPTLGPLTVPFQNNTNNPTGNTAAAIAAPTPTVTMTIVNLAHSNATNFAAFGLSLGGNQSTFARISPLNRLGGGQNNQFTALPPPVNTAGTGIAVATNHAFMVENAPQGISVANLAGNGRHRVADIVIDFSVPVQDPVVHFAGLGGSSGGKNFTSEFTYIPANSIGVTAANRISGNFAFVQAGNQFNHSGAGTNIAANCGTATAGAAGACGSVHFDGDSVSRIYLEVYLRSTQATAWPATGADAFLISVSGEFSDMSSSVTVPAAMTPSFVAGTTYNNLSVSCANNGPNTARGAICVPFVSAGALSNLNCAPATPAVRTPGQAINCTFSYLLDGPAPLPTTVNFFAQTRANSDLNGGQDLTAGNNMSVGTARLALTPPFIVSNKDVSLFSQDGSNCAVFPGVPNPGIGGAIPGSCLEYVITLTNQGSIDANDVRMLDQLASNFTFVNATRSGFNETMPGFSFTTPAPGTDCAGSCLIEIQNARLALDQTGTIRVRVLVK